MSAVNFAHEDVNELESAYDENALIRLRDFFAKRATPEVSEKVMVDLSLVESGGTDPEVYQRLRTYLSSMN